MKLYLRLRHRNGGHLKRVTVGVKLRKDFDISRQWVRLPAEAEELQAVAHH